MHNLKNNFGFVFALLVSGFLLSGWGFTGHSKIGEGTSKYFDPNMVQFHEWAIYLIEHSSDADKRKSDDDTEVVKHYIDIDNYASFVESGFIPQDKDTLIALYGESFVDEQGTLPWSTMETFDSLVSSFSRLDFDKAQQFAADLSHYVADGHMPLHITNNYDGKITGNDGIHSQYETEMIGRYVGQIEIVGGEVNYVNNISDYIFDYIYAAYPYVDSILLADDYARKVNSDVSSSAYSKALWDKTKDFTIQLFELSSKSTADLIYTAWLTAGSPLFENTQALINITNNYFSIDSIFVDYNHSQLHVVYSLNKEMNVEFKIVDIDGKEIKIKYIESTKTGNYNYDFDVSGLSKGIYFLVMKGERYKATKKFII